jgi:hypothetical protein
MECGGPIDENVDGPFLPGISHAGNGPFPDTGSVHAARYRVPALGVRSAVPISSGRLVGVVLLTVARATNSGPSAQWA